jgi:hypothetical protein
VRVGVGLCWADLGCSQDSLRLSGDWDQESLFNVNVFQMRYCETRETRKIVAHRDSGNRPSLL